MLSADSKVRTLLYGLPNQNTINYFQEQMNKVNDVGSGFANWVRQGVTNMYNSVYSAPAIIEARRLLQETAVQFRDDICHIVSYDNYKPNLFMQQYIMVQPRIADLHRKDMLSNFNGTYRDLDPKVSDVTFKDNYLRVVNNQYVKSDDHKDVLLNASSTLGDLNNLTFNEQVIIQNAWSTALRILEDGDDPTDI